MLNSALGLVCSRCPQVNMYTSCAAISGGFDVDDLDLWPFQLKIGTPIFRARERLRQLWIFLRILVFELQARTGQMDRRTDGRDKCVKRPIRQLHYNLERRLFFAAILPNAVSPRRYSAVIQDVCIQEHMGFSHVMNAVVVTCSVRRGIVKWQMYDLYVINHYWQNPQLVTMHINRAVCLAQVRSVQKRTSV